MFICSQSRALESLYERPDEAVSLHQTEGLPELPLPLLAPSEDVDVVLQHDHAVLVAGRAERVLLLLLMGQMWLVGGGMR